MNKLTKTGMIAAAVAAVGLSAVGVAATHAATSATDTNPMTSLVQAIASKFNLKTADVQAVVDAQKATMQAQRQQNEKTRLDAAVTAGKLTQAQEDLIIAKQAEEQTFRDSLKSMSQTDRQAAMKTHMADLKTWATANNIPLQYLPFGRGGMGGHGGGRGMMGETPGTETPAN